MWDIRITANHKLGGQRSSTLKSIVCSCHVYVMVFESYVSLVLFGSLFNKTQSPFKIKKNALFRHVLIFDFPRTLGRAPYTNCIIFYAGLHNLNWCVALQLNWNMG